ncbi:hypothetical protein FB593_11239 [Rhizobium sp. SJZ105]|nr:hypothetical protein FB593_11239 [Rhizobium sp. SJZ105]
MLDNSENLREIGLVQIADILDAFGRQFELNGMLGLAPPTLVGFDIRQRRRAHLCFDSRKIGIRRQTEP